MKVNLVNYGVKLKKRVLEGVILIIFVEYTRGLSFVLLQMRYISTSDIINESKKNYLNAGYCSVSYFVICFLQGAL